MSKVKIKMKKGFTLVEIMIVVAIITILAAVGIVNLPRTKMTANESAAQATLKTISTACETFCAGNGGAYPDEEADLIGVSPPYLAKAYDGQTFQGYAYSLSLGVGGYTVTATPASCGRTGNKVYTITTGAVLTEADCT